MSPTATKTFPSGAWQVSDIINNHLVTRTYYGSGKREAVAAFKAEFSKTKKNPVSPEANELYLFAISDSALYRQQGEPFIKNLAKKKLKGVFNHALAVKLYGYLADSAAKKYTFEFGDRGSASNWNSVKGYGIFTTAQRREAAAQMLDYYMEQIDALSRVLAAKGR